MGTERKEKTSTKTVISVSIDCFMQIREAILHYFPAAAKAPYYAFYREKELPTSGSPKL
jgi:hypothetical protein